MRRLRQLLGAAAIASVLVCETAAAATTSEQASTTVERTCAMAIPATRTTINVEMPNAGDFCELASQALSADVFHTPVFITDADLWQHADATISCRLRYRRTADRITVYNSTSACQWFRKHATGWHPDRNERSAIT